jgi:hypothetical protein
LVRHLIEQNLGDNLQRLKYSILAETEALETQEVFEKHYLYSKMIIFVINGDVYAPDFPFDRLS